MVTSKDIQIVYVFPERLENNKNLSGWGASPFLWGGDKAQCGDIQDIQIVYVFPERLENNKNLSGWGASQFLWGGDKAQCGDIQRHPDCVRLP